MVGHPLCYIIDKYPQMQILRCGMGLVCYQRIYVLLHICNLQLQIFQWLPFTLKAISFRVNQQYNLSYWIHSSHLVLRSWQGCCWYHAARAENGHDEWGFRLSLLHKESLGRRAQSSYLGSGRSRKHDCYWVVTPEAGILPDQNGKLFLRGPRFSQGLPNLTCNYLKFKADIDFFFFVSVA